MAVNQPLIGNDQAENSWKLEVTNQVNNEEARLNNLVSRVSTVEDAGVDSDIDSRVRVNSTLIGNLSADLNTLEGRVDNLEPDEGATLVQNDYSLTIADPGGNNNPPVAYQFTAAGDTIPETHMVFLGGMRLAESTNVNTRDYSVSGNTITLSRTNRAFIGLDLILTVFTLT